MPSTKMRLKTLKYLLPVVLLAALFLPVPPALAAPPGPINNVATATFRDANANNFTSVSNTTTVTVLAVYTVSVTTPPDSGGLGGTVVYYPYTVTNTGNDNNTFALTAVTGPGGNNWAPTIYLDANNDNVHQAGETTVTGSTGILAPGGIYRFFVGVAIPAGTANGQMDDTVLDVTGSAGGTAQDNVVTTAQAPNVTVVKAVRNETTAGAFAATANAATGQILEYRLTVTNGGAIAATSVVLTDPDHTWTTYVANSTWIGSNGVTFNGLGNIQQDDDSTITTEIACAVDACGYSNASAGGLFTANLGNTATEAVGGSLSPASTVYVYFRVRVD